MKRKIGFVLGAFFIIAVTAVSFCLIIFSKKTSEQKISFEGVWLVYQYAENKVDNEIMVFDKNTVSDYRDRNIDAFSTSSYTYENGELNMPDVSKKFTVRVKSDNNIVLMEPDTKEWKMARIASSISSISNLSPADLAGKYNVVRVAGETKHNEVMTFSETTLVDTRNGEEYISCDYLLENNGHLLHATEIGKDFLVYMNANNLILIDCADRYVWELAKLT